MNKLLNTLLGAAALSTMLPAFAGPDWQMIEQARKHKGDATARAAQKERSAAVDRCVGARLALALDHGPRATTTPYLNEQRMAKAQGETRAC